MSNTALLNDYAYDNAEPPITTETYVDSQGTVFKGAYAYTYAQASNCMQLLVEDFVNRRGIFSSEDYSFDERLTVEDLQQCISATLEDLSQLHE